MAVPQQCHVLPSINIINYLREVLVKAGQGCGTAGGSGLSNPGRPRVSGLSIADGFDGRIQSLCGFDLIEFVE